MFGVIKSTKNGFADMVAAEAAEEESAPRDAIARSAWEEAYQELENVSGLSGVYSLPLCCNRSLGHTSAMKQQQQQQKKYRQQYA